MVEIHYLQFLPMFLRAADEQIAALDGAIEALSAGAEDAECRDAVRKGVRIMKGTAALMGLQEVVELVGPLEPLAGELEERGEPISAVSVAALRRSLRRLERVVGDLRESEGAAQGPKLYSARSRGPRRQNRSISGVTRRRVT